MNDTINIATQEFQQLHGMISVRRSRALQAVNSENLLAAWEVGAFVSARLKNSAWGSKTVTQLSEYLRAQDPTLRGYSRGNIYKMVLLYDTYSSAEFAEYQDRLKLDKFVQPETTEIVSAVPRQLENVVFVQAASAQMDNTGIAQPLGGQIVSAVPTQFPIFLNLTTLSNHFEILNACNTVGNEIFYTYKKNK